MNADLDVLEAGVKSNVDVAGVNANLSFVIGVEYLVAGVSLFAGDEFSSFVQVSLKGLDLTFVFAIRFAFCDVLSGEGVCGM